MPAINELHVSVSIYLKMLRTKQISQEVILVVLLTQTDFGGMF